MFKKSALYLIVILVLTSTLALPTFASLQSGLNSELSFRYFSDDHSNSFDLAGVELNPQFTLQGESGDLLTLAFQIYVGGSMHNAMKDMHYGNAYLLIPTGLDKPTLKIGQQVIPFGQLAEYDTHSQIIQTLYPKTLGLRIDTGVSVFGILGKYDYWLMVSNGNGPNRTDNDDDKVLTARIARSFTTANSDLRIGLSGLTGVLPYFKPGEDIAQNMHANPDRNATETKTRYALDIEYSNGPALFRGELVSGKNRLKIGDSVITGDAWGYYGELRYLIVPDFEVIGKYDYWRPNDTSKANFTSQAIGFKYNLNKNLELQFAYERFNNNHVHVMEIPAQREAITLQLGASF